MKMIAFVAACGMLPALGYGQQYLMLVDSGTPERVALLNPMTGVVVNPAFIVEDGNQPFTLETPKDILQVGNEIWISDQIQDAIFRFTASETPTYIGQIGGGPTGGLDNIRGMGIVGDRVYVCNAGTGNGAPGGALVVFDFAGNRLTHFLTAPNNSPFDVIDYHGQLLVSDSGTHDLVLFNTDGTLDRILVNSDNTTMRFPQQMVLSNTGPNGEEEIWVAGFSPTTGAYRFDSNGVQTGTYAVGSLRGIYNLPSGEFLVTSGTTLRLFAPPDPTFTTLETVGSAQYIGVLNLSPVCVADVDDGGGTGTPDGGVTIDDLLYYLTIFEAGSIEADVDNGSFTGTPDGGVTIDDLLYYLFRFESGC
jgi:hypothetical protein